MNPDVIAVGWNKWHIHLLCTDAGLALLPAHMRVARLATKTHFNDAFIEPTAANVVALRVLDLISESDVAAIRKYLKKEKS